MGRLLCLTLMVGASAIVCMAFGPISPRQHGTAAPPPVGSLEITGYKSKSAGYMPVAKLKAVAALENLENLDLSGCDLAQNDYEWLADLRALRILSLHSTGIRDPGFAHLAGLRELEELDLSDTDITQKSLPTIGSLSRLRKLALDLSDGLPDSKELAHLTALGELRTLTLSIKGTDEEWRILGTLIGLEVLTLEAARVTEQGLNHLSALKQLRRLTIKVHKGYADPKPEPIAPTLQLPRLESLVLWWMPFGDTWAARLGGCPNLQRLHVHSPYRLTDAGAAKIAEFTRLRELSLFAAHDLTDHGVEHLANLKELRLLDLSCCPAISDKAVAHIVKLRHLRHLDLACPKISDQGIRLLAELKQLEHLNIDESSATDACIPDLARLSRLEDLWIIHTRITTDGRQRLEKLLPHCRIITKHGIGVWSRGGRPAEQEVEPPVKSGVVLGTLVAKGRGWIEVKADGEEKPRAYAPVWEGGAPKVGGRWDNDTLEAIKKLKVGSRLRVEWKYDLRPRIIKMEELKP